MLFNFDILVVKMTSTSSPPAARIELVFHARGWLSMVLSQDSICLNKLLRILISVLSVTVFMLLNFSQKLSGCWNWRNMQIISSSLPHFTDEKKLKGDYFGVTYFINVRNSPWKKFPVAFLYYIGNFADILFQIFSSSEEWQPRGFEFIHSLNSYIPANSHCTQHHANSYEENRLSSCTSSYSLNQMSFLC